MYCASSLESVLRKEDNLLKQVDPAVEMNIVGDIRVEVIVVVVQHKVSGLKHVDMLETILHVYLVLSKKTLDATKIHILNLILMNTTLPQ
jgi:hypothetical protein